MFINAFWLTNCAVCIKLINNANCKIVCRNFNIRHDNEMSGKGMRRPFTIRSTVKMQDTVSAECPHCGSVTDCAVICTKTGNTQLRITQTRKSQARPSQAKDKDTRKRAAFTVDNRRSIGNGYRNVGFSSQDEERQLYSRCSASSVYKLSHFRSAYSYAIHVIIISIHIV